MEKRQETPEYVISLDMVEKENLAYCVARKDPKSNKMEVVMTNRMGNYDDFMKEVNSLAKGLNAKIIE